MKVVVGEKIEIKMMNVGCVKWFDTIWIGQRRLGNFKGKLTWGFLPMSLYVFISMCTCIKKVEHTIYKVIKSIG